jgi:photosystem II stability/assembly factor-like uncharacterized protein
VDPTPKPEGLSLRARRAVALIAASLTVIVVASLLYLHPKIELPATKVAAPVPTPSPKLLADRYWVDFAFVTPALGWSWVEVPMTSQYWIFRTTDGARTWEQQLFGNGLDSANHFLSTEHRNSIQFFDRMRGLIYPGGRAFFRTSDGGRHWSKMSLPYAVESLSFADPLHGWLLGWVQDYPKEPVYHLESTADGGETWTALPSPPKAKTTYGFVLGGLTFRTPGEGWARGTDRDQPAVYSSKDGGISWQQHLLPVPSQPRPAGGVVSLLPGRGVLAVTPDAGFTSFDGGATWRQIYLPLGTSNYGNFAFEDATHWWSMQSDGNLYKTSDAGQKWQPVSYLLDNVVYEIGIVDARNAWARLDSQNRRYGLALTTDGGVHWTYANVPAPP